MTLHRAIAFLALLLAAAPLHRAQDSPAFRSATTLVEINVLVRDKKGPVSNLSKDDFALTDNGKSRTIRVFSVTKPRAPQPAPSSLPGNTFSNRTYGGAGNPGSVTVVLLDRLNTLTATGADVWEDVPNWLEAQALASAKQQLVKFVQQMDSRDRVAIYSLAQSLTVLSDFTGDRDQLLNVLEHYEAISLTSRETVEPAAIHTPVPGDFNARIDQQRQTQANLANANRAQITMTALSSIAAHLAAIPGRKNLVWLTANLPFPGVQVARVLGHDRVAVYPMDARGLLSKGLFAPRDQADGVYGLEGRSAASGNRPTGQGTMEEIAADTGGRAIINTNGLADAIHSAVEDDAVCYTLGFYPDANRIDGKFHKLKVSVKEKHLDLRYPKGYFAIEDARDSKAGNLLEAGASPLEATNVHLLARVERVNQPKPDSISISASVDLHQIELVQSGDVQKGAIEILIVQQDASGLIIGRETKTLRLELSPQDVAQLLKTGVMFREIVESSRDAATLRIVAADRGTGATGSLIIPMAQIK